MSNLHKISAVLCVLLIGCFSEKSDKQPSDLPSPEEIQINDWIDYAISLEDTDTDSSIYYYQKAGKLADSINSYNGKIRYAYNYSVILNQRGKFLESETLNRNALHLAQVKNDTLNIAKGFNNIANTFNYRSLYDTAYFYYLASIDYFKKVDFPQLYIIYLNAGAALSDLGRYEEAITYYDQSLSLAKAANDSIQIIKILNNKGNVAGFKKENEQALIHFYEAIPYSQNHIHSEAVAQLYGNLANIFTNLLELDSALLYYQKYYDISEKQGNEQNMGIALHGFSAVNFEQKKYKIANDYSIKSLQYLYPEQSNHTMKLYNHIAQIKHKLGAFDSSYFYFSKYIELRDKIQQEEIQQSISQAEKKYQLAQKEEELLAKELQLTKSKWENRKKNWYLTVTAILMLTSGTIAYLLSRNIKQKNKLFIAEREMLQKQKEMSVLKAGIEGAASERLRIAKELHDDLGTGLTSIRFMAEKIVIQNIDEIHQSSRKIQESIKHLTEQIGEIIWSMNSDTNTLDDLITYVRSKMATALDENDFDFQFNAPNDIPDIKLSGFFRRNTYLLVKEAVHNSIKHSGGNNLHINIFISSTLIIFIKDNGKGFSENNIGGEGNGFKNMAQRVHSLNGTWNQYSEQGAIIQFQIPLPEMV